MQIISIKRNIKAIFFARSEKACFHSFVLLKVLLHMFYKQKDKDMLFASREKSRVVENRLKGQHKTELKAIAYWILIYQM